MMRALCFAILASLALPVCAQAPADALRVEMVFWESIRSSTDPADFRAYLEKYPQGEFAPLARNRLAALTSAAPAAAAVPAAPSSRLPQAGDTWTYRLSEPKRVDGPRQRNYVVTISSASVAGIVEQYAIDGGPSGDWVHKGERQVIGLGRSLYAPYLLQFVDLNLGPLGRAQVLDCGMAYICEASASVTGREKVGVPAGVFATVKVEVQQSWRAAQISGIHSSQMVGGRKLTVWYSPEAKRAVKFSSRTTFGSMPPIDTDFDLELTSYRIK
jgi:hypothetical protein